MRESKKMKEGQRGAVDPYADLAPPKKGASIWTVLLFLVLLPFRLICIFTKGANLLVLWPLRLLLCFAFFGVFVGAALIFFYGSLAARYDMSEVLKMPERTVVLDRKSREIGRLHGENRESVKLEEVPYYLVDAVITREDKRFYDHGGVDWIGVGRSLAQVAKHKRTTQGASTLTMQVARNTYNLRAKSFHRKFLEVALAKRIEATYSKKHILEAYLNRIFWGHTYLGISSAARCYFGKLPTDLTLSESALLAGIIYGPNEYSPIKNPEGAKRVRDLVLNSMLADGKIKNEDFQKALAEPIVIRTPQSRSEENYAMDIVRRELERILEEEDIQLGGLTVRTTLDLDLQNAAMDAVNNHLSRIETYKGYKHPVKAAYERLTPEAKSRQPAAYIQGSVVVLDNATGATLVMVGGRDADESKFNRAVQARRQIGSLFKPFVYAAAFQRGLSPESGISDNRLQPGEVARAGRWSPRNSDGKYLGVQPAWLGLVKSRNTMSVRIGQYAGMENVIHSTQLAGFSGKISPTPASYLGTWEATPAEIASGYTVFANGGVRPTPYIVESIMDSDLHPLHHAQFSSKRVFSERAANQVTRILERVTQPGGTAGQLRSLGFSKPSGGKTGTTDNYTNAWFAGFSSSLTCCVWVGMDKPQKTIERGYGGTLALPIWAEVMKSTEKAGYPCAALRMKAGTKTGGILLCRESGHLAHGGCRAARTSYVETMISRTPSELCTKHSMVAEIVDEGDGSQISERVAEIVDEGGDTAPMEPSQAAVPAEIIEDEEAPPARAIIVEE